MNDFNSQSPSAGPGNIFSRLPAARFAVMVAVILIVLTGLYWLGRWFMQDDGGPAAPGVNQQAVAVCSDQQRYRSIDDVLHRAAEVCYLDLSNSNLSELSAYIGYFANLKELNISNNQITGLPSQIGYLTQLEILNASNNQLTELPPHIGAMTKIKILDVSNNRLEGLPAQIGWLEQAQIVNLRNNQIARLPLHLGYLNKLEQLIVAGNPLAPGEISQLQPYLTATQIVTQ